MHDRTFGVKRIVVCVVIIISWTRLSAQDEKKFEKKTLMQNLIPNANLNIGEGYGVVPYIYLKDPVWYFRTDGNAELRLLDLPFKTSFSYTGISSNAKNSNYFKISFDFASYKRERIQKYQQKLASLDSELLQLSDLRQKTLIRKNAIDYSLSHLDSSTNQSQLYHNTADLSTDSTEAWKKPSLTSWNFALVDTTKISQSKNDSITDTNSISKSANHSIDNRAVELDSLKRVQFQLSDSLERLDKRRKELIRIKNDYLKVDSLGNTKYRVNKMSIVEALKKFEVGRCNPNYSTYLISNVSLNGIVFETMFGTGYLAGAIGKISKNFQVDRNASEKNPIRFDRIFDFVNFNSVKESNKVVSLKGGYGEKEVNHLYIGGLYGRGLLGRSFLPSDLNTSPKPVQNVVIEVDGKINLSKQVAFESVLSRSYLMEEEAQLSENSNRDRHISDYCAAHSRISFIADKIRLSSAGIIKWTGPNFKSMGLGYSNNDQISYELRTDKKFGKKLSLNNNLKKYSTNVSNISTVGLKALSFGGALNYRFTSSIQFHGNYQFTSINSYSEDLLISKSNLALVSFGATANKRILGRVVIADVSYSNNNSKQSSALSLYQIYSLNLSSAVSKKINLTASIVVSEQDFNPGTSHHLENYLAGGNIQLVSWCKLFLSGKISVSEIKTETGASCKFLFSLLKNMDAVLSAEKYLSNQTLDINENVIRRYPYNLFLQIRYHW
ncbi:MAG: hypothetical protein EYC69_06530 [Bacteroidetes bacterium]|nr:MAG: hypothetical protein EYC69_06530 [Bacteroidota bacterium]